MMNGKWVPAACSNGKAMKCCMSKAKQQHLQWALVASLQRWRGGVTEVVNYGVVWMLMLA
jgi:hypothetical protein